MNTRATPVIDGSWSEAIRSDAPQLAHIVLRSAPIEAAVVRAGDGEIVVQGRPTGSRRDCAWAVAVALAPMWAREIVPAEVACRVVLSGTSYRVSGDQMGNVARGADRTEWAEAVEVAR
jgi:hypothetical protein